MADSPYTVRVEGLKELQKAMRRLKDRDLNRTVREVNKRAAGIVQPEAKKGVPDRTRTRKDRKNYKPGRLAKSVKVVASAKSAKVKAGSAARVPYAGAIHFGYRKRNISPNRFLFRAMARKSEEVSEAYERDISAVVRDHLESD